MTSYVLTPAQQRYLDEIRAAGRKVYNGRARKPIEALEAAGLVEAHWDWIPRTGANATIVSLVQRITVTPTATNQPNERRTS